MFQSSKSPLRMGAPALHAGLSTSLNRVCRSTFRDQRFHSVLALWESFGAIGAIERGGQRERLISHRRGRGGFPLPNLFTSGTFGINQLPARKFLYSIGPKPLALLVILFGCSVCSAWDEAQRLVGLRPSQPSRLSR